MLVPIAALVSNPPVLDPAPLQSARRDMGPEQIQFKLANGNVIVYLPRTINAGDQISGSVFAQPAGKTWEEQNKNFIALENYTLCIGDQKILVRAIMFTLRLGKDAQVLPMDIDDESGRALAQYSFPLATGGDGRASASVMKNVVESGLPVALYGDFDGDRSRTFAEVNGHAVGVLAEGKNECYITSPSGLGPIHLRVKNNGTIINEKLCIVRLTIMGPAKTITTRHKATLAVELDGLQECTADMFPLEVEVRTENPKVLGFEGADRSVYRLTIVPGDVANGHVLKSVPIRALGQGSYEVSAKVVN